MSSFLLVIFLDLASVLPVQAASSAVLSSFWARVRILRAR